MSRIKVFISGPYTIPDPVSNTAKAIDIWHELWNAGYAPFCPHLNLLIQLVKPLDYEEWMKYCFEYIKTSDCVFIIPGLSEGSERERDFALRNGIPVFGTITGIGQWFQKYNPQRTHTFSRILHECQNQAVRGSEPPVEETLDTIKKEIYYTESSEYDQLKKIAALAISALSRM